MNKKFIVPACLAWYETEEGYTQILTLYRKKILLNGVKSIVWKTICDEKYEEIYMEKLKNIIEVEDLNNIIDTFENKGIIRIRGRNSLFNELYT